MMRGMFFNERRELRNGWKCLAFFLGATVCFGGVGYATHHMSPELKVYVPGAMLVMGAALLLSWIAVRLEGTSLAGIGLKLDGRFARQWLIGTAIGVGLIVSTALMVMAADGFHWVAATSPALGVEIRTIIGFLGGAVFEELALRGFAFQRAVRGVGARWAILIFGIIFSVLHLPGNTEFSGTLLAVAMIDIFMAGVMLSLCYLRTNSLALPIGLHFGWNLTQESLGFGVSGIATHGWLTPVFHQRPDWLTGGAFGLEASVLDLIGMAIVIAWLWRDVRKTV